MTAVINNSPNSGFGGNSKGFLLGVIVLIVVGFYYRIPLIRGSIENITSQINVQGKVDVNVHQIK